jgi:hypothetical protein
MRAWEVEEIPPLPPPPPWTASEEETERSLIPEEAPSGSTSEDGLT